MTNAKNTKKALLMSALSLLLCFSMLLGTTYAWFTDSVTSTNNIIKSGTLDIELEYWNGTDWVDVSGKSDILTNTLWEPGVTEVAYLRAANAGTLALKYQLGINIISEIPGTNVYNKDFSLSDHIMFGIVEGVNGETNAYATREAAVDAVTSAKKISEGYTKASSMLPKDELYLALVVYMPTTVGNEANHNGTKAPEINLGINVYATQVENEKDSFDELYDKDSVHTLISTPVALPATPADATETTLKVTEDSDVSLSLPAELISDLVQTANAPASVALSYSEPQIDAVNNTVKFDHIELVDENGDIIDLETLGNDKPITVKFNVGNAFNAGDTVIVYHDDEIAATVTVDADKNVTYTALHFCEVTVGYNDGKIDNYVELENTIAHAEDGDTIVFGGDITSVDGILIENKNLTIDLNGYTFSVSDGADTNYRAFKITGSSVVTIKNGTIIADGDINGGAYGSVRTEGAANVTLENLKLYNYRGGGLNVKANPGTNVTINGCEIYSQYGGGVESTSANIVLNDTKIEQKGVYGTGWYSVAMEINGGGKITVNSGEYSGSAIATDANASMGNCVAFILSSGGTLDINGGTFNGVVAETAESGNFCGLIYADKAAVVNIYGGTFNSNGAILDMRNNEGSLPNPSATIYGGEFSADPTVSGLYSSNLITLAEGTKVVEKNGSYIVGKPVTTADELKAAITGAKDGDVILIANDITVTDKWDNRYGGKTDKAITIDGLGNTLKFTGAINDGSNYHAVFRLTGAATVKNLTFDFSEAAAGTYLRAISAASDIIVDNCTFIGSDNYTKDNAVNIGDINSSAQINVTASITNCTFTNWRRGVSDNENAKELKSVVIDGNTFNAANVYVSAYESATFTNNKMNGSCINITSYTNAANAKAVVTNNTLDAEAYNVIGGGSRTFTAANVTAQDDIIVNAK